MVAALAHKGRHHWEKGAHCNFVSMEPKGRSVPVTDDGDVSPLVVDVSTWRHDLISPLPGAPQHDILIMKLTAAKK